MANPPGPGEYIPPPRNEAGNRVFFYDLSISEDKEPGVISSVNNNPPATDNIADIVIVGDPGRTELGVPFAWGEDQPERGYVRDFSELGDGGELGG